MIDLCFILAVLFHSGIAVWLYKLAARPSLGTLRGLLVNPVIFLNILSIVFAADFCLLFFSRLDFYLYETSLPVKRGDVLLAYVFFLACLFMLCLGTAAGLGRSLPEPRQLRSMPRRRTLVFVGAFALALLATVPLAASLDSLLAGQLTRQNFFAQHPVLLIAFAALVPAYAGFLCDRRWNDRFVVITSIAASAILLLTGSRGALLLLCFCYVYHVCLTRWRLSFRLYALAIPSVVVLLLVLRFYFREADNFGSLKAFIRAKGGLIGVFFDSGEVSMAEVISTILTHGGHIARYPFESFLAALMYPLPRSVFTFKPLGADAAVSAIFSPDRWFWTRSEITVTIFSDYYLQFGFALAIILMLPTGFIWGRVVRYGVSLGRHGVVVVPFAMWAMYQLLRSGIYNTAGLIWPWLMIAVLAGYLKSGRILSVNSSPHANNIWTEHPTQAHFANRL